MKVKQLAQAVAFAALVGGSFVTPSFAADGDKMQSFDQWATGTARQYNGRIPRQVYMDEMGRRWEATPNRQGTRTQYLDQLGRRWDSADANQQGLTPAEASRLSGNVDSNAATTPMTGSQAQPGNMGPGSTKAQ